MEADPASSQSLVMLQQAFQSSDLDGDGLLRCSLPSLEDLRKSTGLNVSELTSIFEACQGPQGNKRFLTFEEFASGFLKFPGKPDLSQKEKKKTLEINVGMIANEETIKDAQEMDRMCQELAELLEKDGISREENTESNPVLTLQHISSLFSSSPVKEIPSFLLFPKLHSLLSIVASIFTAQNQDFARLHQLIEDQSTTNEAISRECESLKKTCRTLTEKTRDLEKEWDSAAHHTKAQNEKLREELHLVKAEEEKTWGQLEDVQELVSEKEALISKLQKDVHSLSRYRDRLPIYPLQEAAPAPAVPKTSKTSLKFSFTPLTSPSNSQPRAVFQAQDSYRRSKFNQIRAYEKALEAQERDLLQKEAKFDEILAKKCGKLIQENEELRTQLLRERIKSEQYKVMAGESPLVLEGVSNSLYEELALAEPKGNTEIPIPVKIIPTSRVDKPKRKCWFFSH